MTQVLKTIVVSLLVIISTNQSFTQTGTLLTGAAINKMKTDLPASLEIDAFMPFSNVDGTTFKTEAAQKFNIQ